MSETPSTQQAEPPQLPTSQPVLLKAVRWGLVATLALVLVFALIGWWAAGQPGLIGGVIGAAMGGLFLLMTAGSIVFANRFVESPAFIGIFFGVVLGTWFLKFVIFIVLVLVLRGQSWLDSRILFFGLVASIMVSLVIDVVVATKSRIPIMNADV